MEKYLLVGLGNPLDKYQNTRHNVGQMFILWLKEQKGNIDFEPNKHCSSLVLNTDFSFTKRKQDKTVALILALPQTFMNESGVAVKKLLNYYQLDSEHLIVIHDDNDLKVGQFKITFNQKSAGHKGIESIINHLKTQKFHRVKIGIQPLKTEKRLKAEKIVLKKFAPEEQNVLNELFCQIGSALENYFRQIIKD